MPPFRDASRKGDGWPASPEADLIECFYQGNTARDDEQYVFHHGNPILDTDMM